MYSYINMATKAGLIGEDLDPNQELKYKIRVGNKRLVFRSLGGNLQFGKQR